MCIRDRLLPIREVRWGARMKTTTASLLFLGAFCGSCTYDPREDASLEQINTALQFCEVSEWEIVEGIEDVTTDLVVNFGETASRSQIDCFGRQMQKMGVIQTTAWIGAQEAELR